ncbi:MAG: tetratricopeptide repeat protein [Blastocatellia bacterium]
MHKSLVFGLIGLIAGLAIGFFGANALNRDNSPSNANGSADTISVSSNSFPADAVSTNGQSLPAVDLLIEQAKSEPQNFGLQMRTGDMYAQIGRFDQAVEYYKKGLVLKPNDFNANVVLANALFDSRKFEEAGGYYAKAVAINGKDVNARTDLGTTFVERAAPDLDRAIKEFQAALEIEPNHEPTLYYLGIAYHRKGDAENAAKALAKLEKANPGSDLIGRLKQNINPPQ